MNTWQQLNKITREMACELDFSLDSTDYSRHQFIGWIHGDISDESGKAGLVGRFYRFFSGSDGNIQKRFLELNLAVPLFADDGSWIIYSDEVLERIIKCAASYMDELLRAYLAGENV